MANQEHLDILKRGEEVWNQWRKEHADIQPNLSRANLRGTIFIGVNLGGTDLRDAILFRASFLRANLADVTLSGASLYEADLKGATLSGANLYGADLKGATLSGASLSNGNLADATLSGANLYGADLKGATLSGASLSNANLSEAKLKEVNFWRANLSGANLNRANLSGANLSGADLSGANLSGADLSGANLDKAEVAWTLFTDMDLSKVEGLETVQHHGPSSIGIDTIIRSQGKIPDIFLRNAGIPNSIIEIIPSLVGSLKPIDFYSCFISCSSKDQSFAERLYADLQSKGVRCWFAPEDMKIGDKIRPRSDESIRVYDKLLLVLSKHSVGSEWVEYEVETALAKERKGKNTVLLPIRLDNTVMECTTAWAAHIQNTRHIRDFIRWKNHDDYQKAFSRLFRDLKAEAPRRL